MPGYDGYVFKIARCRLVQCHINIWYKCLHSDSMLHDVDIADDNNN